MRRISICGICEYNGNIKAYKEDNLDIFCNCSTYKKYYLRQKVSYEKDDEGKKLPENCNIDLTVYIYSQGYIDSLPTTVPKGFKIAYFNVGKIFIPENVNNKEYLQNILDKINSKILKLLSNNNNYFEIFTDSYNITTLPLS